MDRRRRVRLGAQRDDAAHAPVVRRSPDGFGRRLHHHTLSLGLPAWHLPRPRTASSAAVATRRVTSPGRVASSLDASALCPARPLPTRPGPGRQPSAAGSRARLPDSAATGDPAAFGSLCLRHLAHHPWVGSSRIPSFLSAADGAALHTLPASSSSVHPPAAAVNVGVVGLSPRRWSHSLQIHTQGRASWVGRGSSLSFSEETPHRPPAWLRYGDASSAPSSLSFLVALRVRTPILCAPLVVITTVLPSVAELSAWGKRHARAGGL